MKITNLFGLPEALVKAVSVRLHNDPGRLSATTLLLNPKQILLTARHWDELEEDIIDRFWALFGTAIHKMLESEGENEFAEELMSHELDGITVTGRIDNYNMKTGDIADYKSCSVYKIINGDFADWRRQGLIYAWLLHKNGFMVKTCRFIAIMKDHSMRKARRQPSYPRLPVYVYEFPVSEEGLTEIESYMKGRIAGYKRFRETADDDIPPCTPDERWEKPAVFAVKKDGSKRAYKLLDTLEEAEKIALDMGKGYAVEKRPGESTRCADYCSCCEFCNFFRDNVAAADERDAWPA
ncbi:MAG: hypothetical protein Pg6C_00560 [Treponemataceae bacterium]|nr:MAG: hypothetical protein Pg6C_00560 [Treponemataceae bacterium]